MKILVVEDDPQDFEAIHRAAARCGAQVAQAHDAVAALSIVEQKGTEQFELVIIDLGLRGEPGTEVLRTVRSTAALVPVIILTRSRGQADIYAAYKLGANAYVVKSASPEQFDADMLSTMDFWLRLNRAPIRRGAGGV